MSFSMDGVNFGGHGMTRLLLVLIFAALLAGCIRGGGAQSNSGKAIGGAGVDVDVSDGR